MRRRSLWALAVYTLLAILLTWPLVAHFATYTTGDGIDDPALAWNLWWAKARLVDQLNPNLFHVGWMFHPVDINLAFYTLTPLNGLLSIPLQVAFGLTVANNLLLLSSFVLGGFGTYLLVRQLLQIWSGAGMRSGDEGLVVTTHVLPPDLMPLWVRAHWAALAAGGIYAFASAKLFYAALGQFNIASSQWIPFCTLYLVRLAVARTRRAQLTAAAWAGFFLLLQAWAELTYASFLLIFVALYALWLLLIGPNSGAGWRARLRSVLPLLLTGAIFTVGLLPILLAMVPDLLAEGDFFGSGGGFADVFSADLLGYLLPTRLHPILGAWVATLPFPNDKGQHIFLGYTVMLLALAGAVALWRGAGMRSAAVKSCRNGEASPADLMPLRLSEWAMPPHRRWFWLWVPLLLIFWLLTLGPQVRWAGAPVTLGGWEVPGPFALVSRLPFFSGNRYPSRYSVMLLLAATVLAGAGLAWLLARLSLVRRGAVWAGLALFGALLLFEHLSVPLPLSDQRIPPIFARIAAPMRSDTGVLLELPAGWRNGARVLGKSDLLIMAQQWWQTEHGLRRLGGNTSRNPEFKFQYFTDAPLLGDLIALFNADQPHLGPVIDSRWDELIARNRPVAAQVLDFLGVEYVAVYVEQSPPQLLRFVDEVLPLALVAEESSLIGEREQTIRLYRVDLPPTAPPTAIEMGGPLANLVLAEGWSPAAGEAVRYAVRPSPRLLLDLPAGGARVVLEWAAPLKDLQATVNGRAAAVSPLDDAGRRWALDVPAGVADQPVDEVVLRLAGEGVPAAELAGMGADPRPIGATGAQLAGNVSLLLRSAGEEVGDFAHIWLNGVDMASGERGYNLLALDAQGAVLGAATFDTLASEAASAEMAAWLGQWPAGTLIAGAAADEASFRLQQEAVDALRGLGVATDLRDHFRWSHAFVGVQGAAPGTALEAADLLHPAQVHIGPALNGPRVYGQLRMITTERMLTAD